VGDELGDREFLHSEEDVAEVVVLKVVGEHTFEDQIGELEGLAFSSGAGVENDAPSFAFDFVGDDSIIVD
jgi:hypothetical protein